MIFDPTTVFPLALIRVSGSPQTSTVSASLDGTTVTSSYDEDAGTFELVIPSAGDWTVSTTNNSMTASKTVSVEDPVSYDLTLTPPKYAIGKVFSITSSGTWTCEQTGLYRIEVHGGGGGGGGSRRVSTSIYQSGAAGGGSGAVGYDIKLEEGTSYSVTIGSGGSGGSLMANGSTGGTSRFGDLVTVYGGGGGSPGQNVGAAGSVSGTGFSSVGNKGGTGGGSYPSYGSGGAGASAGGSGKAGSDGGVFLTLTAYE